MNKSKPKTKIQQTRETNQSEHKKSSTIHKNTSETIKPLKKKFNNLMINSSLIDGEIFRSSLPGLSGKKVLQRFAPLLSENQKI